MTQLRNLGASQVSTKYPYIVVQSQTTTHVNDKTDNKAGILKLPDNSYLGLITLRW